MAESKRIVVTEEVTIEHKGGKTVLAAGETYLLGTEYAEGLVDDEKAYPVGEPPTSAYDGTEFHGAGAYERKREHDALIEGRPYLDWTPGEGDPPALNDHDPRVATLRQKTIDELAPMAHRLGIATDEVVASGSSGRVKDDWVRHILRAQGHADFYATPEPADDEEE